MRTLAISWRVIAATPRLLAVDRIIQTIQGLRPPRVIMATHCLVALLLVAPQAVGAPNIQHWQTRQGVQVYLVQASELPMLDVRVLWNAGSARDGAHSGLAALTAAMLGEGAGGLSARQLSHAFESLGAVFASGANRDRAFAGLRTLSDPELLRQALHNFKLAIHSPDFSPRALQRQINNTLLGIQASAESPSALAEKALYAALYGQHPYATPVEGTADSLPGIRRETLVDFYQRYYVARNATLVLVGDITQKQAVFVASALFADAAEGAPAPPLPAVSAPQDRRDVVIAHPSEQTHILLGQPVLSRKDPDYFPLYVGNHILGGSGMVSRLFVELRETRGLSYSVYSYFFPLRVAGPFVAGMQTKGSQAAEARALLLDNIRAFINTGPGAEELAAAQRNITGGFPLRISSNGKILDYVSMIAFHDLPLDYLDTFNARVEAVTVEQIREAFQRRLGTDGLLAVLVGQAPGHGSP